MPNQTYQEYFLPIVLMSTVKNFKKASIYKILSVKENMCFIYLKLKLDFKDNHIRIF